MTIAEMQKRLTELGYNPGPADGAAGKRTTDALKIPAGR
jgi:peptidoglycan hydrolase-like protein with peptidoglycan-binding domain